MREVPQKEPPMKGLKDLNRLELAAIVIIAIVPVTLFLIAAASFNCGAQSVDEWKVKDVATHEDEVTEPVIEHHDEARDVSCYIYKGNKDAAAAIHCVQIWRFEQLKEDLDRLKEYEP